MTTTRSCGVVRTSANRSATASITNATAAFGARGQFYQHDDQIPPVYPDGVYVLGWALYGGTQAHDGGGNFGDYHDCMFINIRGGALEQSYRPKFEPGPSGTARDGKCAARTNRLGDCLRERCNGRCAAVKIPREFERNKQPKLLQQRRFVPYEMERAATTAPMVYGISIRKANDPDTVYASSTTSGIAYSRLTGQAITITCDVEGSIEKVEFLQARRAVAGHG
eukprot:TRINITY_DN9237_c0_g1_i1.p1 TRINITY_DN9237_c0_g1~~TRINITY_DN9237_c0_g1_i1.p1  ORF type:complete len:224 (-),score=28.89 TRINITY_DN9237_c0_g1_i1:130-801(-)